MPRYCQNCRGITPAHPVKNCPICGIEFGSRPRLFVTKSDERPRANICEYKRICAEYLSSLKWEENYFDRSFNRCYCSQCYLPTYHDTYDIEGAKYVIPRGWCRFGLRVDNVRAQIDHIWDKWIVTYHGTSRIAAQSIVVHRQFLVPGDTCIDGSTISIRPGHIKNKHEIYTSPTIAYSSLPVYCPSEQFRSNITNKMYYAKMVLQCRQKPGTFTVQRETIAAGEKRICQFIPNHEIEFFTTIRSAIVTYGILIQLTEI